MTGAGSVGEGSSMCVGNQLRVEVPVRTFSPSSLVLYLSASSRPVYLLQSFHTSLVESQGLRARKCCLGMAPQLLPGLVALDSRPHFS